MKLKITIIIKLLFVNFVIGQIKESEINGTWIEYKSEMKDGSRILPISKSEINFSKIVIRNSKFCMDSSPIFKTDESQCLIFSLEEDVIKTSIKSGYHIEKSSSDTLVICQKIAGLENDKLKRSYLVDEKMLFSTELKKRKGEKNIVATKLFTPKLNVNLDDEIFIAFKNNISNIDVVGSLTIFPGKKVVTSEISYSSVKSNKIGIITNVINNSFDKWDLTNFEEFESIKIPFIIRSEIKRYSSLTYKGVRVLYFTNTISEFDYVNRSTTLDDMEKSNKLFQKGIKAYSDKNYIIAAEYFSKSYKTDPKNIDALYNKAVAYFEGGDKENACKTWKELVDLGQTNGIELYKNNCN